jgi:hypothetical protein
MPVNETRVEQKPRKRGRKTILNEDIIKILERSLITGNHVTTACALAEIPTERFYKWMNKGRLYVENDGLEVPEEDEIYIDLFHRISYAQAQSEDTIVSLMYKFATEDWRAAAEFAKRRWPQRWGDKKLEMKVEGAPIDVTIELIKRQDPVLAMQLEAELQDRFRELDPTTLLEGEYKDITEEA